MIGLDTNVLVRYLTRDDEAQWQQAVEVIEGGEHCFLSHIVLCGLVWVLRGKPYQFNREEIGNTIEVMLQCAVFEWEDRSTVYQALKRFRHGKADFSDYTIGAIANQYGCISTMTFDRKLKGEIGFLDLV